MQLDYFYIDVRNGARLKVTVSAAMKATGFVIHTLTSKSSAGAGVGSVDGVAVNPISGKVGVAIYNSFVTGSTFLPFQSFAFLWNHRNKTTKLMRVCSFLLSKSLRGPSPAAQNRPSAYSDEDETYFQMRSRQLNNLSPKSFYRSTPHLIFR
jgi:hypothetical protein